MSSFTLAHGKEPDAGPKLLLDAREAARALSICPRTLHTLTASGRIPAVRLGRRVLYPLAALEQFIRAETQVTLAPADSCS
jgi:excisionase family DNA binding protein